MTAAKVLTYPLYLLYVLSEEITGEGPRYRRQRRLMVEDRPPLGEADFLKQVLASEADAPLWLAVRRAMAECCGVPAEAVYPRDRVVVLLRMHFGGPDVMEIVFRLERDLVVKIPRGVIADTFQGKEMDLEFGPFAAGIVEVLRRLLALRSAGPGRP